MFYQPDQFATESDIDAEFERFRDECEMRLLKESEQRAELDRRHKAFINTGSARLPDDEQAIPDSIVAIDPRKKCFECYGTGMLCEDVEGVMVHSVCWSCVGTGRSCIVQHAAE